MKAVLKKIVVYILTLEARILLARTHPTIIAITGSVGKTSTKDAVYEAIKHTIPSRKSQKGFNSEIGVPLAVLGLNSGWNNPIHWLWNIVDGLFTALFTRSYPAVLILEMGVDAPGNMKSLTSWIQPDVVVLTRLPDVPVHVESFTTPQAVIEEKMTLVHNMKANGMLVYNHDDAIIQKQLPLVRQKTISYARYAPADVKVGNDIIYYNDDMPAGISFDLSVGSDVTNVKISDVAGVQHAYAVGAAIAVARHIGVTTAAAIAGVAKLTVPPGRMRIIPGLKGTVLIDDTYNSSPIAVEAALDTLSEITHSGRTIAVLGDMLELGKYSTAEHERIGAKLASICDVLLCVGVRARGFAAGALAAGMDESAILQYERVSRAGQELQSMMQPGDLVLIKGSQGMRMERIVEEVMAEPQHAASLLARQEKAWKKIS